jgi:hypothetical protein
LLHKVLRWRFPWWFHHWKRSVQIKASDKHTIIAIENGHL